MKILLISPPHYRLFDFSLDNIIPRGLCYIAATVKNKGHEVSVYCVELDKELTSLGFRNLNLLYIKNRKRCYDIINNINDPLWEEVRAKIKEIKPDVVGISSVTATYDSALNIAKIVKEINSETPVVFGGVHPSTFPHEVIKEKSVDFVVRGEGEESFLELIRAIEGNKDFETVKGILYKKDENIIQTPPRPLIDDIDSIPFPAVDTLIDFDYIPKRNLGYIFTSRGCPYSCNFCASCNVWTREIRLRSPDNVISEVKTILEKYNINEFFFFDDTFTFDRARVAKICDLICTEGLKISWGCYTRLDALDKELLEKMKISGCNVVSVGIETYDDKRLKEIKKGFDVSAMIDKVKLIRKNNIRVSGFVMLGFPDGTKEDFTNLKKFINKIGIDFPDMSITTPYPGTELYENLKKEGKINSNLKWYEFYPHNPDINLTKIEQKEFENLVIDFAKFQHKFRLKNKFKNIISDPKIILRWSKTIVRIVLSEKGEAIKKIGKLLSFGD